MTEYASLFVSLLIFAHSSLLAIMKGHRTPAANAIAANVETPSEVSNVVAQVFLVLFLL